MNVRRGFTLIELAATCLILAAVLTVCLQLLAAVAAGRRASQLRQTALEEATSALERIYPCDYRELTPQYARQAAPPDRVARMLPQGRLEITVGPVAGDEAAKRIGVAVLWRDRPDGSEKAVRLVAWKHRLPVREGQR